MKTKVGYSVKADSFESGVETATADVLVVEESSCQTVS